jgi:hypothetical protein
MTSVSKNKAYHKGMKISRYWRHPKKVTAPLKAVPQQEFQKCFQRWQYHWAKCKAAQGVYFEGNSSQ